MKHGARVSREAPKWKSKLRRYGIASLIFGFVFRLLSLGFSLNNLFLDSIVDTFDMSYESRDIVMDCPHGFSYVHDLDRRSSNSNQLPHKLIPNTIYQTSRSRCIHEDIAKHMERWKDPVLFPGVSYFLYDDEAMDEFLYDKERWESTFPTLNFALQCAKMVQNPTLKADIWRYLILWEYGGIYADIDCAPSANEFFTVNHEMIYPKDDGLIFIDRSLYLSQVFLAVSPRHPIMYYSVHAAVQKLLHQEEINGLYLPDVTGFMAVSSAMATFKNNTLSGKDVMPGIHIGEGGRSLRVHGLSKNHLTVDTTGSLGKKRGLYGKMNMTFFLHKGRVKEPLGSCYNLMNATKTENGFIYQGENLNFSVRPLKQKAIGDHYIPTREMQNEESFIPLPVTHSVRFLPLPNNVTNRNSFRNQRQPVAKLRNFKIAFMGDSLTRYQYLDLVYFLKYGNWIEPTILPSMTYGPRHGTWDAFFNFSKSLLHPFEQCDCFREEEGAAHRLLDWASENRYYYDPSTNNSVSYFQKFGKLPFRSYWEYNAVHQSHELIKERSKLPNNTSKILNWTLAINNFIANIKPKPEILVFNAGHWKHEFLDASAREKIIEVIAQNDMVSVYKTTSKRKEDNNTIMMEYEQEFCKLADYCLDLSWTGMLSPKMFWDGNHPVQPVYSWMNVKLLYLLSDIIN